MKKLYLFLALLAGLNLKAQDYSTLDFIGGYTDKGGLTIGLGSKRVVGDFGFYVTARGLSYPGTYQGGIDYGGITDTDIVSEEIKTIYYGFIGGFSYSIPKTGLSILAGSGLTIEQQEIHTFYRYDFQYINDEYSLVVSPGDKKNSISFEGLIDYDFFFKNQNLGLGVQLGYNNVQSYIIQGYFNIKF